MNANKWTALGTIVLALIGVGTIAYGFHKDGMRKIEQHSQLEGHPKLVAQIEFVVEELREMKGEFKEVRTEIKEIRSCMHRIEKQIK